AASTTPGAACRTWAPSGRADTPPRPAPLRCILVSGDPARRARPRRARPRSRPRLELLEGRLAPADVTVTTAADDLTPNDGSVSLREAITTINAGNDLGDPDIIAQAPGTFGTNDTIDFSPAGAPFQINVGSTGLGAL